MATDPRSSTEVARGPEWEALKALAEGQEGCFTARQAGDLGFSAQILSHHARTGTLRRVMRGIYQISPWPAAAREQEDLVVAWLWSDQEGVLSHESALQLHGLSDALPSRIHLTVPASWSRSRLVVPDGISLHFADVPSVDRIWVGSVPVTTPARAIVDVAGAHGDPQIVEDAIAQALARNLVGLRDVASAVAWLAAGSSRHPSMTIPPADGLVVLANLSGRCPTPPPDWRSIAATLAGIHGGTLHSASYASGIMRLEIAWPFPLDAPPPDLKAIRSRASRILGWR